MHTPTGSSSATLLPPFDQEKYPSAKFWYQREWKQYKKAKRHAGGISNPGEDADEKSKLIKELAFGYLTDKNGERVSLEAIDAVRDCCRQTYTSFDTAYNPHAPVEHRAELPPKKWKKEATLNQRTTLRRELESRFEFMRFCADGWKSERLAIDTLPGFRQKHPAPRPLPDEQFTRPGAGDSDNSDSSDDEPVRTSRTRKHADDGRNSGSKRRRETVIQQRPTNVNEAAEPLSHRQDLTETSSRQIRLLANPLHTLFDGDNGPRPDREPTPTPTARPAEPEDSTAASDRPRDPDAEPPLQEESTDDAPGRQLATAGGGENVDRLSPPIIQTSSSRENGDGQTSGSMAKKGKGPKPLKFDENSPVTARTLCGIDWCEANPGGSAVQFKTYWDGLPKDDKKDYDKKARALKAAGKGPLDTVN
ncbi:uncharacterized protein PHACADRAFT_264397 [Phanerochaete carnosa HHB-10118-sp]|uniref:Uncharacterized protein n=1 Tax=Phanerochaete carnosa (strain HHB-10118-sp) TaxID=650164 RepID=K5VFK8_PHACS|nr:uncharacterized protein PHACADRAFT_264397 [Phanerochaete carnosa HHB-10118-sp]EKM49943.1 hypothetical protein PHACADRAFT_264397 [Phanerochaete carnosa HHB-10118-sp]